MFTKLIIQIACSLIKCQKKKKLGSERYYCQTTKIVHDSKGFNFNVTEAEMAYKKTPKKNQTPNQAANAESVFGFRWLP